ncbi:Shedu anti-phage system protein SduA domain-containing protein [Nocardioides sp. MH1]|uniref:Shedu anti-phage system protein SduA domain-containing protein n=1 Tax=Nocardioides sp. MH1 TaxID=3242490 RepID=UPI00352291A0
MAPADPDDDLTIPFRDVSVALSAIEKIASAMDFEEGIADAITRALLTADPTSADLLPEVGAVVDAESARLHLHRIAARLREHVPTTNAPLAPPPVTQPEHVHGGIEVRRPSRSYALEHDELARFAVPWLNITWEHINAYTEVLEFAETERPLQTHLAQYPLLLAQHLGGGHGRWVIPQKRLGAEYVPDFVIAEKHSGGFVWQFVELQSPQAKLFVPSSGRQSAQLDEGLRQILEWRRWLESNLDYARRPRSQHGLGLTEVGPRDKGLLIIGRERDLDDVDRQRRRQLSEVNSIAIHTYDWLAREAGARVRELSSAKHTEATPD